MTARLAPVALGIACGLAVIALWSLLAPTPEQPRPVSTGAERAPVSSSATPSEVAELRARLIDEVETRNELARELDELRVDVEDLVARLGELETTEDETEGEEQQEGFDEAVLREAGLSQREAEELRARYDQAALDRLYLRDQALREGWFRSPRWSLSNIGLRLELQEELGPARYDWMLYAAGRNNRIAIREVISGSVAADAGLRRGDVIMSYDGREVFSLGDLRVLLSSGQLGERVELGFDRGGSYREVGVERGPLGARLDELRTPPPALR